MPKKSGSSFGYLLLIIFAVFGIIVYALAKKPPETTGGAATTQEVKKAADERARAAREEAARAHRGFVGTGNVGYLSAESGIAATEADFSRFNKLSRARDVQGVAEMALAGRLMIVEKNTQVRVIDHGVMVHEVRILSGEFENRSGFVAAEFVSQNRSE